MLVSMLRTWNIRRDKTHFLKLLAIDQRASGQWLTPETCLGYCSSGVNKWGQSIPAGDADTLTRGVSSGHPGLYILTLVSSLSRRQSTFLKQWVLLLASTTLPFLDTLLHSGWVVSRGKRTRRKVPEPGQVEHSMKVQFGSPNHYPVFLLWRSFH